MKKTLLAIILLTVLVSNAYADSVRKVIHASCRVTAGGAKGSGTAVYKDDNNIYVLTNSHVTSRNRNVQVEFWKYGRKTKPISGTNIWSQQNSNNGIDFSIISIPKDSFKSLPEIISFAPSGYKPNKGDYVFTAGCPSGGWMSVKEGFVLEFSNRQCKFYPVAFNGQSGSGLFTIINKEPRLIGVVTARSGGGNISYNNDGFSMQYGISYNIDNLRGILNRKTKSYILTSKTTNVEQLFALGDDGKYWPQTKDGGVVKPHGVEIIRWNCPPGQPCPPQPQPPRYPQPRPPGGSPQPQQPGNDDQYGQIPPGFGESDDEEPEEPEENFEQKYNELKEKYDELQAEYEKCQEQLKKQYEEGYGDGLEDMKKDLEKLKSQIEEKDLLIIELEKKIDQKDETLEQTNNEISNLNIQLEELRQQIIVISTEIEQKEETIDQYENQIEELNNSTSNQSNTWNTVKEKASKYSSLLFLLLGGGGVFALLKRRALMRLPSYLSSLLSSYDYNKPIESEKPSEPTPPPTQTPVHDPEISKMFTWLQEKFDKTDSTINSINANVGAMNDYVNEKFKEFDRKQYQTQDHELDNRDSNNVNVNINNSDTNNNPGSGEEKFGFDYKKQPSGASLDRIKQFFELKKHDGETIEQWAMYAILYREAIQRLRRGEFEVLVVNNSVNLQGQRLAAKKLDEWVRDQYIRRTTVDKIQLDWIYHEAMLGFLYKEAVSKLRYGEFPVLGAKETADVIENWVKEEFLKRMGINL